MEKLRFYDVHVFVKKFDFIFLLKKRKKELLRDWSFKECKTRIMIIFIVCVQLVVLGSVKTL